MKRLVLALLGPTASGKTALALELAEKLQKTGGPRLEIVALDSTTVYRGFDIGSSKPTAAEQKRVPHHLVDVLAPEDSFSVGQFVTRAEQAIDDIFARDAVPLVVGGTYFYLRALEHGMYPAPAVGEEDMAALEAEFPEEENDTAGRDRLVAALAKVDPVSAERIHRNDRYRLLRALAVFRFGGKRMSELAPEKGPAAKNDRIWMKYAMAVPRPRLWERIEKRTDALLEAGLLEETRTLRAKHPKAAALGSIGYAECVAALDGRLPEARLAQEIVEKTRQLAKRQMTWLRSDESMRFVDDRDSDRMALELANFRSALGAAL